MAYVNVKQNHKSVIHKLNIFSAGSLNPPHWIGARRGVSSSSPYYWINGGPVVSSLWASGEPNYEKSGSAACAYTYESVAKFFDASCGDKLGYTCQKCTNLLL